MNIDSETILVVEDNEDDVFIFKRAYRQAQIKNPLQVAQDGEEASDYLFGRGRFADRAQYPRPGLVLLDLKLPLKGGLEVLQELREAPETADLCVVVLTSSAEERDIARAHGLRAQAYLVKPPSPAMLLETLAAVQARRVGVVDVPRIAGDRLVESELAGNG